MPDKGSELSPESQEALASPFREASCAARSASSRARSWAASPSSRGAYPCFPSLLSIATPSPKPGETKISAFIMFILHIAPRVLRHERTDLAHERPMTSHAQLFGMDSRFPKVGEQEARHRTPALQDSCALLL